MRDMGLNTIQFYVPWNLAELEGANGSHLRFIKLASKMGFWLLLRPGPYICGEWDFGGFPARLQKFSKIRTKQPEYYAEVEKFWGWLLPSLKDELWTEKKGGRIVMVQIENEYGSYGDVDSSGDDQEYMEWLLELAKKHLGNDVQYYTTDNYMHLGNGGIHKPELNVYHVGDFGPDIVSPQISFANMRRYNKQDYSPEFVSEYYTGWMTAWHDQNFATTKSSDVINTMKGLPNFNLYMAFGGTNFGFSNGLNLATHWFDSKVDVQPQVTSYDYNGPIAEDGSHGIGSDGRDKFADIKAEIESRSSEDHSASTIGAVDKNSVIASSTPGGGYTSKTKTAVYPDIVLKRQHCNSGAVESMSASTSPAPLLLSAAADGQSKATCRDLDVDPTSEGFYADKYDVYDHVHLYRFVPNDKGNEPCKPRSFEISAVNDRVYVYVGFKLEKILDRNDVPTTISLLTRCDQEIDFLVENFGRQNFSPQMGKDRKGFDVSGAVNFDAKSGRFVLCGALFDGIVEEQEIAISKNEDETVAAGESAGDKNNSHLAAWSAFNSTRDQMHYIWPLMDKQLAKDVFPKTHPAIVSRDKEKIVVEEASTLVVDGDVDRGQVNENISKVFGSSRPALSSRRAEAQAIILAEASTSLTPTPRQPLTTSCSCSDDTTPAMFSATFEISDSFLDNETGWYADTFLDMRQTIVPKSDIETSGKREDDGPIGKGVAFVNGMNLGRYWNSAGPSYSLYVPGVMLKPGKNAITIVELESPAKLGAEITLKTSDKIVYK
ncbi:unnamed protein product [Amoebophrya sp. A25]|nr:unnamed protein product [Amoebophrya sp. A25]|eukprot:GSA25T00017281001.1